MKGIIDFFIKIKEALKNPKTRSLTMLGIYAIFFIIVILLFNQANHMSNSKVNTYNKTDEKDEITVSSYEYVYTIKNQLKVVEIKGTHNNNQDLYEIDNVKYYKEDNNVIDINNPNRIFEIVYDIDDYSYLNIESLINNSNYIEETTYNDGSKKLGYETSFQNLTNYIDLNYICLNNICGSDIVNISIIKKDDYINSVIIDMTNYYGYEFIIELNYSNINNISDIKISTQTQ